jgi:two-component system response regulator PilR (NtrC family)
MQERIAALLVHDRPEPMGFIRRALECQFIETQSVRTCREAHQTLWERQPPHLVLTDTRLADGSWEDVVLLAAKAPAPVNVIVVSEVVDIAFYLETLQRGAFDFIVPPMPLSEFNHVVRSAVDNARRRRESQALNASRAKTMGWEDRTDPACSNSGTPPNEEPIFPAASD